MRPLCAISGGRVGRDTFSKSKMIKECKPKVLLNTNRVPITVIPVSPVVYVPQAVAGSLPCIPYAFAMGCIFAAYLYMSSRSSKSS